MFQTLSSNIYNRSRLHKLFTCNMRNKKNSIKIKKERERYRKNVDFFVYSIEIWSEK